MTQWTLNYFPPHPGVVGMARAQLAVAGAAEEYKSLLVEADEFKVTWLPKAHDQHVRYQWKGHHLTNAEYSGVQGDEYKTKCGSDPTPTRKSPTPTRKSSRLPGEYNMT